MRSIRNTAVAAVIVAILLPLAAKAQSSDGPKTQAAEAYRQREFLRSAELFLAAAKLGGDGRTECLYNAACGLARGGRVDEAFAALEQAVSEGMDSVDQLKGDSDLASLRGDTRWKPLLDRAAASAKAVKDFWTSPAMQAPYAFKLSEDEKIAGLSKLWAEAKFNFIHFDKVPGLDWDALYLGYLQKVRATNTTLEYYRVLQTFYVALKDGHTGVSLPKELRDEASARPLVRTELVENRVMITAVADNAAKAAGVTSGLEIVSVDGIPIAEYMQSRVAPYQSASTPQDLDARGYGWALLEGPLSRPVELTLSDASGVTIRRSIERRPPQAYWDAFRAEPMVMRLLPGNVAYVALNSFGDNRAADMFEATFGDIDKADALVIDVRENGGGNSDVGYRVLACLTDQGFRGSKWRTRDYRPSYRAWGRREGSFEGDPESISPNGKHLFRKPVVVLAGPRTYSAAEDFVVAFRGIGRGKIVGEATGGSTGQPLMFPLPGGGSARVCTKHDSYADGTEFVGIGIAPDRVARLTIGDLRSGRDSALEAALELLRAK